MSVVKKLSTTAISALTHTERIAALNQADIFLPPEYLLSTVLPLVVITFLGLSILYGSTYLFMDQLLPLGAEISTKTRRKVCYQLTNFCANSLLGLTGLYTELFLQPKSMEPELSVRGFEHFIFFSCFQLGYQLWAIPVGGLFVGESFSMLVHHIAVICVACMSGLMTNGFRYWTPFFYGVIELSSIPLAIMNTFKDNPDWIKQRGGLYLAVRLTFCVTFLWVRLILFIPRQCTFLRDHFLLFTSSSHRPYRAFMSIVFMCAVMLLILQVYWGFLIMKGLLRHAYGNSSSSTKSKTPKEKNMHENGEAENGEAKNGTKED